MVQIVCLPLPHPCIIRDCMMIRTISFKYVIDDSYRSRRDDMALGGACVLNF